MIPAAALGERFGHRRVLLGGVALFTLGSAQAALATIGPLVGGAIVSGWSWHAVFWMNVPLGVLLLVLGRLHLPPSRGEQRALDLPGGLLIGASLFSIIAGISSGNSAGWGSVRVLFTLGVGVLLLVAFLWREQRASAPMIALSLLRVHTLGTASSIGFVMNLGTMGSIFFLTQFLQNVLAASPLVAGLETMPWTGTIMLVAPLTGWLTKRLGRRAVVLAGMLAQAAALVWIGALASPTVSYAGLLPAFVLAGAGMGLALAPLTDAAMSAISESQQGQASGMFNTLRQLGGCLGSPFWEPPLGLR
jgi:MFS family permease